MRLFCTVYGAGIKIERWRCPQCHRLEKLELLTKTAVEVRQPREQQPPEQQPPEQSKGQGKNETSPHNRWRKNWHKRR